MDHSAMGHAPPAVPAPAADDAMAGMAMGSMSMDGMSMRDTSLLPPDVAIGPGIDMVSMAPVNKMGDPGLGLRDVPHRVLNYRMLSALEPNLDPREPSRLPAPPAPARAPPGSHGPASPATRRPNH